MINGIYTALLGLDFSEIIRLLLILGLVVAVGFRLNNPLGWFKPITPEAPYAAIKRQPIIAWLITANLIALSAMTMGVLNQADTVQHGIIDLELAKTAARAERVRSVWQETRVASPVESEHCIALQEVAIRDIYFDFLFIVGYSGLAAIACFWLAEKLTRGWSELAKILGWAALAAGVLDVIENLAMLKILSAGVSQFLVSVAFWAALPKFLLILAADLFVVLALLILAVNRIWATPKQPD